MTRSVLATPAVLVGLVIFVPPAGADDDPGGSFLGRFHTITMTASTVPANGDVNPYGVAVVPRSVGALVEDSVLVSNFNNSANLQGTGTTIMQIRADGATSVFAQLSAASLPGACPGGVGLTTALVVLRSGWVIVGSLPTSNGQAATAQAGCLIVLDSSGKPVETFSGGQINGPWDMTALDLEHAAVLFVTNVLNGTVAGGGNVVNGGTVARLLLGIPEGGMPRLVSSTVIGSMFGERTDPAALVIGPTGVGLGPDGALYVADTLANRIAAIPNAIFRTTSANTGITVSMGGAINGPLGLAITPNHHILVANANDGNLVEVARVGVQVAVKPVDTSGQGAGTLFGLAIAPEGKGVYFVNDGNNTLNLLH
ncbi:MAG TPA: hypothetical protein VFA33_17785 [Bryobacteraceae bacterium]|nr:hypothetical protein [Bryobacteraceae bacterium]